MAQKNATPNRRQQALIRSNGLEPAEWTVSKELRGSLIIRHRVTGEYKLLPKGSGKSVLS